MQAKRMNLIRSRTHFPSWLVQVIASFLSLLFAFNRPALAHPLQPSFILISQLPNPIEQALTAPDRPAGDKARDTLSKTADVLSLLNLEPGMKVGDLMAGGGYYTELFSRIVGTGGHVYMQNEIEGWPWQKFFPPQIAARLADDRLANVTELETPLEDPGLPTNALDLVFLSQFYHDSVWMGVDRAAMLQAVYDALKPGGYFCVIDHQTAPGARGSAAQSLHRVGSELVKEEVLNAGFVLAETSDLLRNPQDDHSKIVFDPTIKSQTDRFIFLFQKV
jgi:predicted methyltransferase